MEHFLLTWALREAHRTPRNFHGFHMKRWHRISFAVLSLVLSLPAFGGLFVGFATVVMLSGFRDTLTEAVVKLASGDALVASIPLVLICHVLVFCYLLIQFVRAKALPVILQAFCLLVVIGTIVERIRIDSLDDGRGLDLWFGLLSLPHAWALMTLVLVNKRSSKPPTTKPEGGDLLRTSGIAAQKE
jgi:hypothetical protein